MQTISDEVAGISKTSNRLRFWAAGAVLLAGLLATGLVARSTKYAVDNAEKEDFNFACAEIRSKIVERFRAHEQILRSGAAFLAHSVGVNRQAWRFFTENQQLETQLPGIQGIGFSLLIPRSQLAQHLQEIRAGGFPNYDVLPKGDRELYSSIVYLEPFTNRNLRAFGYDMFNEPVRREAMERARDENTAALSGKVTLVQETGQEVQAGTLMYVPVYRRDLPSETLPQRRAAILGWAYSPYRMNDLLGGILGSWGQPSQKRIRLEIFDGDQASSETRLYDSQAARSEQPSQAAGALFGAQQSRIVLAGRPWTLCFTRTGSQAGAVDYSKVWLVGFGGGSLSLFLAALTFLLLSSLGRARQLARELKQSEERYRTMLEGSPHAVFLTDEGGRIRLANQVAATLAGRQEARDLVGGLLADLVQPAQRAYVQVAIQNILRQGFATPFGCAIPRRDGTVAYAELSGTLVKDFQGLPRAVQAIMQDVTERKRVEAALREIDQRYRLLLNDMGDGFAYCQMIFDAQKQPVDFLYLKINPAFEKLTGLREVVGKKVTEVIPRIAETNAELFKVYGRVTVTGKPEKFEVFLPGLKKWLSVSATPAGEGCFASIFQDITTRKEAEEALRQSEEKYRVIFENEIYAICIFDLVTLRLLDVNEAFAHLYGYRREEIVAGMTIHEFTAEPESSSAATDQASQDGTIFIPMRYHRRKDGTVFPVEIVGGPYHWQGQRVMFALIHDISSRHQAEQALRESRKQYEDLVHRIPVGVYTWRTRKDKIPRFGYLSQRAAEMLGCQAEAALQDAEAAYACLHPEDRASLVEATQAGDGARSIFEWEGRYVVNGETRWLHLHGQPVLEPGGDILWHGIVKDVTERNLAERKVRETLEYLRLASEAGSCGTWSWDFSGGRLEWDDRLREWYGQPETEHQAGRDYAFWRARVHPDDLEQAEALFKEACHRGIPYDHEFRVVHPDGSLRHIHAASVIEQDASGAPVRMIGINRDVTERERVSATMRLQATLLENLSEGIYIIGLDDLLIKWANPIFERMFGYEAGEMVGMHADQVNAPTTRTAAETKAAIRERLQATGHWHGEVENRRKDGSPFWCHANASLFDHAQFGRVILAAHTDITERKRVEAALAEQTDFNERVFNSTDTHLAVVGADGVIQAVNAAWRRFAQENGGGDERAWGVGASYFVPAAEERGSTALAEEAFEGIRQVQQGQRPGFNLVEYPCHSPSGEQRWFAMRVLPLQGKTGTVIVSHTNVTKIKAAEQLAATQAYRYQVLLQTASDGIHVLDQEGKVVEANDAFCRMLGYRREDLSDLKVWDWDAQWTAGQLRAKIQERIARPGLFETRHRTRDGRLLSVEISARGVTLDQQQYLYASARDVTERKRAEKNYRDLFESSQDGIVHTDMQGIIVDANPAYKAMVGYAQAELQQLTYRQLTPEKWHPLEEEIVRHQILPRGYSDEYEKEYIRKDGTIFPILLRTWLINDDHQKPAGMWAIIRDLTERKRIEAEKEQLQAQASQLQKAESLNRMAGAIAHHFNNQLGAATLCLDLAMHDPAGDLRPIAALQDALASVREAAKVSTLMLTYLGQIPIELQPLDLAQTCQQNLPHLQKLLPHGVQLRTSFPSAGPVIDSSASQIKQILINLITNAYEACADRGGTIQLAVTTMAQADIAVAHRFPVDSQATASAYACLEVADNGCGIPPQDIDQVFDPFFSTKFTGRGLGLPVVLGIVRWHHGFAAVESQLGGWSVFRVFLPLSVKAIPAKPTRPVPAVKAAKGGTILLAEDDNSLRSVVARALKMFGYGVYAAKDGVEAMELFKQHQGEIICVLSDLTMPRMDGWETISAIRQISPGTPIILSSGYNEGRAMAGGHGEQPQAFLSKPYDFEELKETLDRVLQSEKPC